MTIKKLILSTLILLQGIVFAQKIEKENLTQKDVIYWDFKKTKIQSTGAYYKDQLGQTRDKKDTSNKTNKIVSIENGSKMVL